MPAGRPSEYTEDIGKAICELIIEGYTLRQISSRDGMPDKATICRWLARHDGFRDQYARAREFQADHMADETLEIADDATNDWMEREGKDDSGGYALNGEHVQRSRLRVDTRKWLMSKMAPKKYGERVSQEITGKDGKDLIPEAGETDVGRAIAFLLAKSVSKTAE